MERDVADLAARVPSTPPVAAGDTRVPVPARHGTILGLQRAAGNAAVSRAVAARRAGEPGPPVQRDGLGDAFGPNPFGGGGPEQQGGGAAGGPAPPSGVNELGPVARTGTLIADTVIASSYTPGAGNIW